LPGNRYHTTLTVDAPAAAKGITVKVSVNQANNIVFWGWGWSCTPPPSRSVTSYTCTTDSESLHSLFLVVKFHPHGEARRLSATVSAPGHDDPDMSNNTASLNV
jgi:hypothetical protein